MTDLPILYYKGKGGALYQWRVWVEGAKILTEYGQVGGQLQTTQGKIATPKNEGRANATTAEQQAELEAKAMHTFKLERKYRLRPEDAQEEELFLPMLATDIVKVKKVTFPAHAQPKSDGVRCLAYWEDGQIKLMSRSGKPYSVPHVEAALRDVLVPGLILDGELYCHGVSCQTIASWVKRLQPETLRIGLHCYDCMRAGESEPWRIRRTNLEAIFAQVTDDRLQLVETVEVDSLEAAQAYQRACIEAGYEGAMVRLLETPYEWGYRSKGLLKVKTFQDGEFEVVGAREGQGKMTGCVVWLCRNDVTDATFECSPACSMEDRARFYQEREKFVGRKLTVKFFDRTDDKLPRFPVGKLFRPIEDLPKEN